MIPNCLHLSGRASLLITVGLGPILLLTGLQMPPLHAAPEPKSPAEVETLALQARQNLVTLYVKLHFSRHDPDRNFRQSGTRTIWVSGDKLRNDVVYDLGPFPPDKRMVGCHHCEKQNHSLYWHEADTPLRATLDEETIPPGRKYPSNPRNIIDPRLLGYVNAPSTALYPHQFSLDLHLGKHPRLRREAVQMEVTRWNGMRCYLLHSILTEGTEQKVWIAPDHGYNIVRITWTDQSQIEETESELQAVGPHNLWFPKQVKHQVRSAKDGTLTCQETVQILEVRLNEEVPPSTFTLAGCLPDGTPVRIYSGGQSIYGTLKNGKVEKEPDIHPAASRRQELLAATPPPPQPLQEQRRWDPWLVFAAVSLTLGALLVLWLWRRSTLPGRS